MTSAREELRGQRVDAVRAWTAFVEEGDPASAIVRPEILRSWERSGAAVSPHVSEAPLADEADTEAFWQESPLQVAVHRIEEDLRRTAEDGDLVLAVTDNDTRILSADELPNHVFRRRDALRLADRRQTRELAVRAGRGKAEGADALRDEIDGEGELVVLRLEHQMQRLEHRARDIPMEIMRFEIERIGIGQHLG